MEVLKTSALVVFGLLVVPVATVLAVGAGHGSLDPSFGRGGVVSTTIGPGGVAAAYALAIQSDGKVVAAGVAGEPRGMFALVRYNRNGSIDPSFGRHGTVTTAIGRLAEVDAIVIQRDGKIVAAGYSTKGFALARYAPNGSLDRGFGIGGVVTSAVGRCGCSSVNALVLEPDGKLVAAGGSDAGFALVRYNSNGSLDTSFGTRGRVITPLDSDDGVEALVLQPGGKLVAAGTIGDVTNPTDPTRFALVRYKPNGSRDRRFGAAGVVTTMIGSSSSASALVMQADGDLVAGGRTSNRPIDSFTLVRYRPNGALDPSFGSGGVTTTTVGSGKSGVSALAIQADGKVAAAGADRTVDGFWLVRYTADGSLDPGFGSAGVVTTDIRCCAEPNALAIQRDGKLVAAGASTKGSARVFTIVRYLR